MNLSLLAAEGALFGIAEGALFGIANRGVIIFGVKV